MNQKQFFISFFCLSSVYGFGETTLKLPQKDTNISVSCNVLLPEMDPQKWLLESGTLQLTSKDKAQNAIVYPIEESNFEEVFGGRQ